ncbi:MAG: hypothetical protein M3O50_07905 [Myxococcota bacterium]|nr:hypothetical protein [Myxococcota bacterium]
MALSRSTPRPAVLATAALFGASALLAPLADARADNVSPTGKGITGGALLGAEVVTITESLAGVRSGWAYAVGAIAGAAGGGVGGYFVEHGNTDGKAPTYMLAGGLALVIPAVVLVLNGTRYIPDDKASEDNTPQGGPAAEPGVPGAGVTTGVPAVNPPPPAAAPSPTPAPPGTAPGTPPQSLFNVQERSFRVGMPIPEVRSVYSVAEERQYGITGSPTEVRLPMLHVTF